MPGFSLTEANHIMKNLYLGPIREQLNNETPLLANIKKSSKEVVGKLVVLPLRSGRNWGVGARGTTGTGTLPTARSQQYSEANFQTKDVYGRILVYGKTIRAMRTDAGAFERAVPSETKGMVKDLASDINRQLNGDASGVLATITANSSGTTITVDNTQYLEEGMFVDIGADTGVQITAILSETSATIGSATTVAINDNILITGVADGYELNGLDLITADSGELETIDPADAGSGFWKGVVNGDDTSPVPLTESDMQLTQDNIEIKGGKVDLITTSYKGRAAYINLLTSLKRYTSPYTGELKGGFKTIDFNGIQMVVDRHVQQSSTTTRMNFLTTSSLGLYRMADFEWANEDGNVLARQTGTNAVEAYEGTLVCDMEFATDARNQNGRLEGIQPVA